MSLGCSRRTMSRTISEGRSQKVACCLEAAAFWWRFFCWRSVRLDLRGSGAVVSTSGSSAAEFSFRIVPSLERLCDRTEVKE